MKRELKEEHGDRYPVYMMTMSQPDKTSKTEKYFYTQILNSMDSVANRYDTAQTLRQRILNVMSCDAAISKSREVILIIDEAQFLDKAQFSWLKSLYDEMKRADIFGIDLIVFLIGMEGLKKMREQYIASDEYYIAARFMNKEFYFSGITEVTSVMWILDDINTHQKVDIDCETNNNLTAELWPETVSKHPDKSIVELAEPIWNEYSEYHKELIKHGRTKSKSSEISMQSFMNTMTAIFKRCSVYSRSGHETWPTPAIIRQCVRDSGFDIYG